jgi:hypothetical protein
MVALAYAATVAPPIWCELIWGCNHELVAPPNHGAFVGIVTTICSRISCLKTDLSSRLNFGHMLMYFWFHFPGKRGGLKITTNILPFDCSTTTNLHLVKLMQ